MEEKKVSKARAYKTKWRKENIKEFRVDLNIDLFNELEELLKENNLTKASFLRQSIEQLKEVSKKN